MYIALYWRLLSRKKPIDKWAHAELPPSDGVTADNVQTFPKIVVQLPMFNEKEVGLALSFGLLPFPKFPSFISRLLASFVISHTHTLFTQVI